MAPSSFDMPISSAADDHVEQRAILSAAVDRGASDVHLKAGRPPVVRFDGDLERASRFPGRSARSSWRTS